MLTLLRQSVAAISNAAVNRIRIAFDLDNKLKTKDQNGDVKTFVLEDSEGMSSARPYKVLSFNISQTGTDDPTATVLENTAKIGTAPVFARDALSDYRITLEGAFPLDKIPYEVKPYFDSGDTLYYYFVDRIDDDTARILTFDASNTPVEAGFGNNFIEIRIYP